MIDADVETAPRRTTSGEGITGGLLGCRTHNVSPKKVCVSIRGYRAEKSDCKGILTLHGIRMKPMISDIYQKSEWKLMNQTPTKHRNGMGGQVTASEGSLGLVS